MSIVTERDIIQRINELLSRVTKIEDHIAQENAKMCAGEDLLTQENYDAWVKHFRDKVIEECANAMLHDKMKHPEAGRIWKDEAPFVDEEMAYRRIMALKDGSTPGFT